MKNQNFKFFDKDQKQDVNIPFEKWRWVVTYKDGSTLHQFDTKTGKFHQFKEIDQAKGVVTFAMVSDKNPIGFQMMIPEGADLIHFYRNRVTNAATPNEVRVRLYMFGWKRVVDNYLRKRLLCIHPDDRIEVLDDDGRPLPN